MPGPDPPDMTKEHLISLVPPVFFDSPAWGKEYGECVSQPPRIVKPGDTISARFVSKIFFKKKLIFNFLFQNPVKKN